MDNKVEFKRSGFPIVRIYDESFEVKAIDFWNFRSFQFDKVKRIEYRKSNSAFWFGAFDELLQSIFDPYRLKIYLKDGSDWTYDTPREHSDDFQKLVEDLRNRCNLTEK